MPSDDELDELIEQITIDAYGDEVYWSFLQAIEDDVRLPVTASLVGAPVEITGIDFDGDEHRGLVATVKRDGTSATISILDLDFTERMPCQDSNTLHSSSTLEAAWRSWKVSSQFGPGINRMRPRRARVDHLRRRGPRDRERTRKPRSQGTAERLGHALQRV